MQLKRQCQYLKAAQTVPIESFKKRKLEVSSLSKLAQLQIDVNKLSTDNTGRNTEEDLKSAI